MTSADLQETALPWGVLNRRYLEAGLQRLRLLLRRRVLWLRRRWQQDPIQAYQEAVISDAQADALLAGEAVEAEALFYQAEPEAVELSRSLTLLDEELLAQRRAMAEAGMSPAMDVLMHLFDLTPFEREVLLLCLAPELDPSFGRLYAYVQDEVARQYATPHLALTLFADLHSEPSGRTAARDSFMPDAPLRRFHLIRLEGSSPGAPSSVRPLRLDERIADYLRGVNRLDERTESVLQPLQPAPLAPPHCDLVARLERGLVLEAGDARWSVINLVGPTAAGHEAIAQALCGGLGFQVYRLAAERLPAPGAGRTEMLHLLEREAVLSQLAFYVNATDLDANDRALTATVEEVVERLDGLLLVGSRARWPAQRAVLSMRVPGLDAQAQRTLWKQALAGHPMNGQIEAIVQQFDFGPEAVAQVVASAKRTACLRGPNREAPLTPDDLWNACREHTGERLDELAQRLTSGYTWDDIVLPNDTFRLLREIAAQVAHRPQVYEAWGFGARLHRGRGISALFAGPSGTGKTMAAEILGNHLKLDLYRIDLASVVSKYIGETEKNLKRVFDAAEASGALLFFDEADALFGKRTEVKDSHDRFANIEIDYLLQRMEAYRGLAVLATNRKADLDRAFLRRLRFIVDFPFPDAGSRRRIWQKAFPPQAPVEDLDLDGLARLELPGANIKNIALNAAFLAAEAGTAIRMEHVLHAARREYAKIERLITQAEFGPYYAQVTS